MGLTVFCHSGSSSNPISSERHSKVIALNNSDTFCLHMAFLLDSCLYIANDLPLHIRKQTSLEDRAPGNQ